MINSQFSRFLLVGGASTVLNFGSFLVLLNFVNIHYLISSCIGYVIGFAFGYYFNKSWTFELESDSLQIKLKYLFIYMISLISGLALLNILVVKFLIQIEIANIMFIFYATLSNFFGVKFLVFKK